MVAKLSAAEDSMEMERCEAVAFIAYAWDVTRANGGEILYVFVEKVEECLWKFRWRRGVV